MKHLAKAAARLLHMNRPNVEVGAPPGTLTIDPESPKPVMRLFGYGPDDFEEAEIGKVDEISPYLKKWPVVWVNVDGLGDEDTISALGDLFNLHRLALEDVVNVHQRSKVEEYGNQLFMVLRMTYILERLQTEQLSVFLGKGYVLTFQERKGDCLDPVRDRIRSAKGRIRQAGADYLAYSLLDAVVDAYFPILEDHGNQIEDMEQDVIAHPDQETMARIRGVKRDLLTFRRAVWPLREAVNQLLRDEIPLITADTRIYLRDCYDHTIQVIDMIETHREMASGLMDVFMSSISNRMNEVMKVLTIFAAIFIPLTFIAGIYGMNFNPEASRWNMPELSARWGYPGALAGMLLVAVTMIGYFVHKGWIGGGRKR